MTKEQFKKYVEQQMSTMTNGAITEQMDVVIEQIVAQWESDVNDARIAGQNEYDPDYMESDVSSMPCMGPCCGGSIDTHSGQY